MPIKDNLMVGHPHVSPSKPAHTAGVRQGNATGGYAREPGHFADGRSNARRSTSINWRAKDPIDPRMPKLSPA